MPHTSLKLREDEDPGEPERRRLRRRREDIPSRNLLIELIKLIFPLLVAAGIAYLTAQGQIETKVAVVEAKEQAHWEEIQRTLKRLDEWIARQETPRR